MTGPEDQRRAFFETFHVSCETEKKLDRFAALLVEWNEKFNLVASSTLPQLWSRHFLDSAQLLAYIPPEARLLADLGSGAGFPGLVLALMRDLDIHLIESIGKKARFLQDVAHELAPNVTVHNARIETIRDLSADIVTARALTALPDLLSLAKPLMGPAARALFLKGEKADAELTAARKYWTFACEKHPSQSGPSGVVLDIRNLKVLRKNDRKRNAQRF